ncbi:MAG: hypothetical protein AB8A44_09445 [Prochlorococcus sp.]
MGSRLLPLSHLFRREAAALIESGYGAIRWQDLPFLRPSPHPHHTAQLVIP